MKKKYTQAVTLIAISFSVFTYYISAQTFTEWTSTGTNWSDNSNWSTPYNYGQLEFKGLGNATSNNDFVATSQWRLFFNGANSYTLTGNKVTFSDFDGNPSWLLSDSSVDQNIEFDVEFADAGSRPAWITTRAAGSIILNNISAINGVTQIQFANNVAPAKTIVNGIISGSKDIYIGRDESFAEQANTWVDFNGANTYTGNTFIDAGRLDVFDPSSLGIDADVFIANNGLLRVRNSTTIASVQERGTSNGGNVNIFSGATLTINGANKGNLFQRKIVGQGDLILESSGSTMLVIYTQSNLTGTVTIKSGAKIRLSANMPNADFILESGALLEIEGSDVEIKSLTLNTGSNVQLNDSSSLTVNESLINDGTITLSTFNNGDLYVGGDFTQNGTLINNDRAVFLVGATDQNISGLSNPLTFDYLRINKTSGTITFDENIVVTQVAGGTGYEQTAGDVIVNAGKSVIVNNTGNFVINGGTFHLQSTSQMYSSLIADNVSGSGTIFYNRYVNSNASSGGNDLISAPVTGQAFNTFIGNNSNILANPNGPEILFGGFDNDLNDFELWNETATTTLDAGVGYRSGIDTAASSNLVVFEGTVNTGNIDITVNKGTLSKWNLIGNPYPSYISAQDFLNNTINSSSFSNDPDAATDASLATIYGYNNGTGSGGIYTPINLGSMLLSGDYLLAPGQGFFLSSNITAGTGIQFTPAMRSATGGDDFIQGRSSTVVTNLKLQLSNATDNFITDFFFTEFSSLGLDQGYDASLFGGSAPAFALYSHLVEDNTNVPLAIQALGETDYENTTIALGVNANSGEQLTFSISESSLPASVEVYLEDNETNTITSLTTTDYILTPDDNLSGTGRFYLNFVSNALSVANFSFDDLLISTNNLGKTIVISGQLLEDTTANVFDMQGRLVLSKPLNTNNTINILDRTTLQTGVYVVQLTSENHKKSEKVILN